MNHSWFKKIDWLNIKSKKVKSPYEPQLDSEEDLKYFSEEFTSININADQTLKCSVNFQKN